jgi:DNA-binding GntR family transcriptional regulator
MSEAIRALAVSTPMNHEPRSRRKTRSPARPSGRTARKHAAAAALAVAAGSRATRRQEFAVHPLFTHKPPVQRSDESLGDFSYRIMREAVRSGKFRPGEHLREADVAGWLGISRTPVREAFHRIVSEGLLVNGPWNGVMIAELDTEQLRQLYAVREALEGTAAALAADHATKAEVTLLFEIAAREARARNSPDRLGSINGELHQALYRAAHNPYLLQSLNSVVDALGLLRHSTFVLPGSSESAHQDHLRIITAVREGKRHDAERAARTHVRNSLALRLRLQRTRV